MRELLKRERGEPLGARLWLGWASTGVLQDDLPRQRARRPAPRATSSWTPRRDARPGGLFLDAGICVELGAKEHVHLVRVLSALMRHDGDAAGRLLCKGMARAR